MAISAIKAVGQGVQEMRIDHGPGYGVYYVQRGAHVVILLCGGDKGSQARDIEIARRAGERIEGLAR